MSFTVVTERGQGPTAVSHHVCESDIELVARACTGTNSIADTFLVDTPHGKVRVVVEVRMSKVAGS